MMYHLTTPGSALALHDDEVRPSRWGKAVARVSDALSGAPRIPLTGRVAGL